MPRALLKDALAEIRHSFGRFMSILLIVALGVAFFAGIKASAPDMKYSADYYFDKYDTQDIQVFSTLGLTKEDVDEIKKISGVKAVQALYTQDVVTRIGSSEQVFKLFSMPEKPAMNEIRLVEGRLPEKPGECLIEADSIQSELRGTFALGDTITIETGTDEKISDTLRTDKYKVVGKGFIPRYISYEKGSATIGSGMVNNFMFVPEADIKADYYTEIDVTVDGAKELNAYEQAYFDKTDPVVDKIEAIADKQIEVRKQTQQDELDKAKRQLKDEIYNAKELLRKAQKQVDEGNEEIRANEAKIADGQAQLDSGWQQYYAGKATVDENLPKVDEGIAKINEALENEQTLTDSLKQIDDGINQAESAKAQAEAGITQAQAALDELEKKKDEVDRLRAQRDELNEQLNQLEAAIAKLQEKLETVPEALKPVIQAQIDDLETKRGQLTSGIEQLEAGIAQYDQGLEAAKAGLEKATSGKEQAEAAIADLNAKKEQVQAGLEQLEAAKSQLSTLQQQRQQLLNARTQLQSSLALLQSNERDLQAGLDQISAAKAQAEQAQAEIDENLARLEKEEKDGREKIDEGQKELDDLDGEWIVLDRDSFYAYKDYESCADRMDGIAQVFPVFFFLVAALVCMTTMTRMVEEQRNEIGTLKALGYSRTQIAMKYIIYSLSACVVGCVLGCALGMWIFPYIIFYAWNTMYSIEGIQYVLQPGLMALASFSVIAVILATTLFSIGRELSEVPSQLMRPRAGKAGKKILLEKIPAFWNHVPFLHKVTLRNIFRYKKRFFMTVIGIAGCSALLVAGFGINDSISNIVNAQYEDIYHYDGDVTAENADLKDELEKMPNVSAVYPEEQQPVTLKMDGKDISGYLHIIPDDTVKQLDEFITFHSVADKGKNLTVPDEGVLISQKMAEKMDLKIGSELSMKIEDQTVKAKVAGIFEQYTGHQIYVQESEYDSWHVKEKPKDIYLIRTDDQSQAAEDELGGRITDLEGVRSISFYSTMKKNFTNMIGSIKLVVIVLVASAAMLAFVVLYNLSNVNISERMREIATIKVLGYTDREVDAYVNRESLILAIIGAAAGLLLGIALHHKIMDLAELDSIMFGRTILPMSFAVSFALTVVFAIMVNLVMRIKLKKIRMVESLKAVE